MYGDATVCEGYWSSSAITSTHSINHCLFTALLKHRKQKWRSHRNPSAACYTLWGKGARAKSTAGLALSGHCNSSIPFPSTPVLLVFLRLVLQWEPGRLWIHDFVSESFRSTPDNAGTMGRLHYAQLAFSTVCRSLSWVGIALDKAKEYLKKLSQNPSNKFLLKQLQYRVLAKLSKK